MYLYFLFSFLLMLIPLLHWQRLKYGCINAADFSIYQQAIFEISPTQLNPYLTIRNIKIFNDHFDPALIIMSLWTKLIGNSAFALILGEWLFLVGTLVFLYIKQRRYFLWVAPIYIFSKGILNAFEFPIHPSTWLVLPITMLFYSIEKEKSWSIIVLSFIVCQFRESMYFAIGSLSFYFLINKKWKEFMGTFLIALSGLVFLFYFRTQLLGPVLNYAHEAKRQLATHPLSYFWLSLTNNAWPWKVFIPLIAPILILIWKQKFYSSTLFAAILFSMPIIGLHIIAQYMVHHHMLPMVTPFLAAFSFSMLPEYFSKNKKIGLLIIFSMIFTATSRYTTMIEFIFFKKARLCQLNLEKINAIAELKEVMKDIKPTETILATTGIIPNVLKPGMQLYQLSNTIKLLSSYNYLLLEQNNAGDIYPLSWDELANIQQKCSPYIKKELIHNKYFLLWSGSFSDQCLEITKRWNIYEPYSH